MAPESKFTIKKVAILGEDWCRILVSTHGQGGLRWFDVHGLDEVGSLARAVQAGDCDFLRDSRNENLSIPAGGRLYIESVDELRIHEEEEFPHKGLFVASGVMES